MIKLHKIRKKSGETLVEVIASLFIFLILFGILQGAISYSHASMEKNKQIRAENAEIIQNLASTDAAAGTVCGNYIGYGSDWKSGIFHNCKSCFQRSAL